MKSRVTLPAFEVDKAGLAAVLARRGPSFAVLELLQNCFDEPVTEIDVQIAKGRNGLCRITVRDNSPDGFSDLRHAYTLFAPTSKRSDPRRRGRFNLGEKLVIAMCESAAISTTTGTVRWSGLERVHLPTERTDVGSVFCGDIRMTSDDVDETNQLVRKVIAPAGVTLRLNGDAIDHRSSIAVIDATLTTEVAGTDGQLRRYPRATTVGVYEVLANEQPTLYELGIPVVTIDCAWHLSVGQKVPLGMDRDSVTPAYARDLTAFVLNEMTNRIDFDRADAGGAWVALALESKSISDEAVVRIIDARYGEKRVIADPSDPEGTKIAVSRGYSVIQPGSFSKTQWAAIKRSRAALPAGQVTPSPKAWSDDPNARSVRMIPVSEWTDFMEAVADYARDLATHLIQERIYVDFVDSEGRPCTTVASYGSNKMTFNMPLFMDRLRESDSDGSVPSYGLDELILHELGHHFASDHLSGEYHRALCWLGAALKRLALTKPELVGGVRYSHGSTPG